MYKKTMETIDFGGTKRVEDYYFNLTAAELMEMQLSTEGGFKEMIERIVNAQNQTEMTKLFKKTICKSYGVLSPDGRKFIKNQAVLDDFLATQAYSDLYMEMLTNTEAATEFFNNVIPQDLEKKAAAAQSAQPGLSIVDAAKPVLDAARADGNL